MSVSNLTDRALFIRKIVGVLSGAVFLFALTDHVRAQEEVSPAQLQNDLKSMIPRATASTLALQSPNGSSGSGVIVSADGVILTAAHVVQGCDHMQGVFGDGRTVKVEVLGANFTRDAAICRIVGEGKAPGAYPFSPMGNSESVKVGDYVVAMGHAKGFDPNRRPPVRFGRVVADAKQRFMMSETTLIGGDSGGPLFNLKGEVVGIHSSIGPNLVINNHVPMAVFRQDWERMIAGNQWGQLGLHPMADPNTPAMGITMGILRGVDGVLVDDVVPGAPGERAGLKVGDLVTSLDGRIVRNPRELIRELERHKAGKTVPLVVIRQGQAYNTQLTFARRGDFLNVR